MVYQMARPTGPHIGERSVSCFAFQLLLSMRMAVSRGVTREHFSNIDTRPQGRAGFVRIQTSGAEVLLSDSWQAVIYFRERLDGEMACSR